MNHKTWSQLTPEQQRIKVAELAGWTHINIDEPDSGYCPGQGMPGLCALPDYLNDLNAMHKAENTIPQGDKQRQYVCVLASLFTMNEMHLQHFFPEWKADTKWPTDCVIMLMSATAAQRAEAFVAVM